MRILNTTYKTGNLAKQGIFLLLSIVILLLCGRFFIPTFTSPDTPLQASNIDGYSFKFDDSPGVSFFFKSIKTHKGYLCLGTSESDILPDGNNYGDFLNSDTSLKSKFTVLGGAGRFCGLYIPIFLRHRKELDSLKLIYFINPVYWRTDLNYVKMEYWNRYSNYEICNDVDLSASEKERYYLPVQDYIDQLNPFQKIAFWLEYEIRKSRKSFYQDLVHFFKPDAFKRTLAFFPQNKTPSDFHNVGKINVTNFDTTWNILHTFHDKQWFKPIDEKSDYRYKELTSFISTCRDLGIHATFIIGPYNGRFITHYDSASLAGFQRTTEKIKQLLTNEKSDFIDATDISFTAGAFIDHQHHSSYGAYLIYKKIKSKIQLDEKNSY